MEFIQYQELAERTAPKDLDPQGRLINGIMGLCGESGEIADALKKAMFHGHELDLQDVVKELGDVLWYVALLSTTFGINLNVVAELNIEKLKKRYPEGFSEEASQARVDVNE